MTGHIHSSFAARQHGVKFKANPDSAPGDKTEATQEKRFILTLLMFPGKDYCLGPCFQRLTQWLFHPSPQPPSPSTPEQET